MATEDDKGGFVGRGGLKLEAAFEKLGGAAKVRGARALDIGASTGGFTECLLKHGARAVTALEVGHGQLHPKLVADPRVTSLERTNFKTVSLKVAPGPFDYFVIDVSFVAARTMLRPLAFRLRPGAEGVILVKPQFELPDQHVHHGVVKSERLRAWALDRVKKKGEELGFTLLGSVESPVELESGTIEVLTRWRFEGRAGAEVTPDNAKSQVKPRPAATPAEQPAPRGKRPPREKPAPYDQRPKPYPRGPKPSKARPEKKVSGRDALPFEVPKLSSKKPKR